MAYSFKELQENVKDYYNRFDPAKEYDCHLMREGKTTQAAEINEIQAAIMHRMQSALDVVFHDGDVVQDGQVVVDASTGQVTCAAGRVYLAGAVRSVPAATVTIPTSGTVNVGVRLKYEIITEVEDPTLRYPGAGQRGEGDPGAWRLKVAPFWAFDTDGQEGDFYPVYTIDDGVLRPTATPPDLDAVSSALRRYDLDATGTGTYAVSGLLVSSGDALPDGRQVYHVSEGRAHVGGHGVDLPTSRRVVYDAQPDLRVVDTEVHAATGEAEHNGQRITVAHPPLHHVQGIRITARKKVSVAHGAYTGALDTLPDTSIVAIERVAQGGTVYSASADYVKKGDAIDWSPDGKEPSVGSTYEVTYTYIASAEATAMDFDGFTVTGAVEGTSILVTYQQALPRYDALCLTADGLFTWRKGVAAEQGQLPPEVPAATLRLATVFQTWRENPSVRTDSVRVVPFDESALVSARIDWLTSQLARMQLATDLSTREGGAAVGLYTDPLLDDSQRDQGISQNGAIMGGVLTLPVEDVHVHAFSGDLKKPTTRPYRLEPVLSQTLRTAEMKVNPYMAFDPLPAKVTLEPAVDRWTDVQTEWASPITQRFARSTGTGGGSGWNVLHHTESSTTTQKVGSVTSDAEFLRQIDVHFTIEGFGAGENLKTVTFDGLTVEATAE